MLPNPYFSDEELVRLYIQTQQLRYFDELYDRYYGSVFRKCRELVQNYWDAQDFTHDIFIKVFHKLDGFEYRSSFSTWLYRVTLNYCTDQLKRTNRFHLMALDKQLEEELPESLESVVDEEDLHRVVCGLKSLSLLEQELLRLKYEQGISIEEIAQQYNITNSAVKMRLMRSRQKVQQFYARQ